MVDSDNRGELDHGTAFTQRPALDFFSEHFDAELALNTPGLVPPDPTAQPLDNVDKCRSILPPEIPESLHNAGPKRMASEASKQKALSFKERASRLADKIQDSCHISLERVTNYVKPGPIKQLLGRWLEAGVRVRVVTRHSRGVRGTATGLLTAYDRYMNVVLKDVEEHYTVRIRVERPRQRSAVHDIMNQQSSLMSLSVKESGQPIPGLGNNVESSCNSSSHVADNSSSHPLSVPSTEPSSSTLHRSNYFSQSAAITGIEKQQQKQQLKNLNSGSRAALVVYRPNLTSADDDPVEPGELGIVAVKQIKHAFCQDHRKRRLAQIFIKGDNIVLISQDSEYDRVQPSQRPRASVGALR
ncbi:hypothetical protein CEUSTIGMA_g2524.t1 [Chlamydomonas eustigma]|uniref:Sm domain-containing protein n=1 Tax=Chlamydomonas eustigma TaxID=1157962 RepID=A0A250WX22_9CHLO|nr:hypothetical protein CEUSTIGMA_g2524.t1 [Chlamydomonas eustigma]|eukprot:GAX75080.1 hypothetical protein CEUSTIGMA_g2524.t1 [Chlamydomonas eustigma]